MLRHSLTGRKLMLDVSTQNPCTGLLMSAEGWLCARKAAVLRPGMQSNRLRL